MLSLGPVPEIWVSFTKIFSWSWIFLVGCFVSGEFSIPKACFLLYCYIYWIQIGLNDLWYVRYVLLFKDHFKEFCFYLWHFTSLLIINMKNMLFLIALSWFASSDSFVFLRFSSFWDVVAEKSQQTVSNWTQHNSFAFFMFTFSHLSKSFLFHFFFLFWVVVANAVGVAGSLFISSGPFCTFQSEPRIY